MIYYVQDITTGGRYVGAWSTPDEAVDILLTMRELYRGRVFELRALEPEAFAREPAGAKFLQRERERNADLITECTAEEA